MRSVIDRWLGRLRASPIGALGTRVCRIVIGWLRPRSLRQRLIVWNGLLVLVLFVLLSVATYGILARVLDDNARASVDHERAIVRAALRANLSPAAPHEQDASTYAWIMWISIATLPLSLVVIAIIYLNNCIFYLTNIDLYGLLTIVAFIDGIILIILSLLAFIRSIRAANRFNRKDAIPGLIIGTIIFAAIGFPGIMALVFAARRQKG